MTPEQAMARMFIFVHHYLVFTLACILYEYNNHPANKGNHAQKDN